MTIDEAIEKYRDIANTDANCPRYCMRPCEECEQQCIQIAEWLEELKAYRTLDKTNFSDGYNRAIDDFIHECDKHCGFYTGDNKNITRQDILRIAEQLKVGDGE